MSPMVAVRVVGAILLSPLTFVPGCELRPPKVTTHYAGPARPVARDRDAPVAVFLAGRQPPRSFLVLGDVEVRARSRNTSLGNLLDCARREARRLGGDALVEVRSSLTSEPSPGGCGAPPATRLVLTAQVARLAGARP